MSELCLIVNEQGLQELKEVAEDRRTELKGKPSQERQFKTMMGMPFFKEKDQEPKFKIMRLRDYELWRHLKTIPGLDPDKILAPDEGRFSEVIETFGPSPDELIEKLDKAMSKYHEEGK